MLYINKKVFFNLICISSLLLQASCKTNNPETSSAYITEVFEDVYAPGQHAKLAKETDKTNFIGDPAKNDGWVYLGGFGGYIIAGFDHNVVNEDGNDFEVFNLSGLAPEPAIVYVMPDENKNGKPDENWFELKGNQFENSKRNYWVRYFKPTTDTENISWKDSEGNSGELASAYGGTSSASWWWPSTTSDSITFKGSRLPDSYVNSSTTETPLWTVPADKFLWGYAENQKGLDFDSSTGANKLDISNAVDSVGNKKNLSSIRFIEVQTGVFQQAGWLNEVSSEVRGAKDLRK